MPFNGSGTFTRVAGNPVVTGTVISSTTQNNTTADFAAGLTLCVTRNGQSPATADLPMGGFKHTGVADATQADQYATLGQIQGNLQNDWGTTAGSSTVYTAGVSPALTAYEDAQFFHGLIDEANGANPTINFDSVGARKVYMAVNGVAVQLPAGTWQANQVVILRYDDTLDTGTGGFWWVNPVGSIPDNLPIAVDSADATKRVAMQLSGITTATTRTMTVPNKDITIAGIVDIPDAVARGRITLTTGVPVTTSDVSAATTLYYTPFRGDWIDLYDGTNWVRRQFTELSLAVPATTNTMYDLFAYDNAGVVAIEALAWTNDTTRATALTTQNGVLVKTGQTTRRYLGSFRTTGVSGQTADSLITRYVWNYYNRVERPMIVVDTTDLWNYTTATYRQARASTANQLDMVIGVSEDVVSASVIGVFANTSAGVTAGVGVGVDSTSVNSAQLMSGTVSQSVSNGNETRAEWRGYPGVGRHTLVWLERSEAAGTTTWSGDGGLVARQCGIFGYLMG